jgi:hypothetical protein
LLSNDFRTVNGKAAIAKVRPRFKMRLVQHLASRLHLGPSPFAILALIAALLLQPIGFCQYVGPLSAIATDFTRGSKLSDNEVRAVVKLAQKAGIKNISKIYSYYMLPTSVVGIGVNGAETIDGRKVSFASVDIDTEGVLEELSRNFTNVLHSEGTFWVRAHGVRTNTLTLFEMKGETIRIELGQRVPLSQADKIVAALSAGKFGSPTQRRKKKRGARIFQSLSEYIKDAPTPFT